MKLFFVVSVLAMIPACNLQVPGLDARSGDTAPTQSLANPSAPAPAAEFAGDTAAALREIEEADVLKIADGRAYVLNQYKGLIIIDVSDPDKPAILGRLAFTARPVEMYVVGPRAYIVATSEVIYPILEGDVAVGAPAREFFQPPQFDGSKVSVIDVGDPAAPQSMGDIRLVGYANASRRVGDVIYVIGADLPAVQTGGIGFAEPQSVYQRGFVASINVADPDNIIPVARETFEGDGFALHVSQTALFATHSAFHFKSDDPNDGSGEIDTQVQYIDISDPAGQIRVRGAVQVPGSIRNRFYLDDFDGVLRIATESFGFGFQTVRLFTYDLKDPDNIAPLGQVEVIRGESLEAVRFDGPRGYLVTLLRKDPLFVVDLTDPAQPAVTGQLEVPGFSTHIEPRGDRLIAVGIDDTDGRRPAVALYDVSNPKTPSQLSRIVLGPPSSFTESDAVYDEKAFKIVDELGLIAIPFQYTNFDDVVIAESGSGGGAVPPSQTSIFPPVPSQTQCVSAVQLIDFSNDALSQRGWFSHRGNVERVGVLGQRAFAMSQIGFQTVNIDDRDNPTSVAFVPFLDESEMPYFDGCGYYGTYLPPDVFPGFPLPIFINLDADSLLRALNSFVNPDGTCGLIGVPPMLMMLGLAGFMRPSRRNKRRR